MKVHVAFTPAEAAAAPTGIVIDVLRATSTIAQALSAGYRRVLCVPEIEQARALRAELPDSIVGGERDAIRIEGFDVGASPREFLEPRAGDADPLDHERDADDRHGLGALRRGADRQPAQPGGGRCGGAGVGGGRRDPLRRLQGRVRARRRLLCGPVRAAPGRRADGRRRRGGGARQRLPERARRAERPDVRTRRGSRRTSPSARRRACSSVPRFAGMQGPAAEIWSRSSRGGKQHAEGRALRRARVSISILPPLWLTTPYAVARPSPVPLPVSFVVKNGSKARVRVSSSMPVPVSVISTATKGPASESRSLVEIVRHAAGRHRVAAVDRHVEHDLRQLVGSVSTSGERRLRATSSAPPRRRSCGRASAPGRGRRR